MRPVVKSIVVLIVSLQCFPSFGQTSYRGIVDSTITIDSDIRLDSLVSRHIRVNETTNGFDGYRVQLHSGSGNEARQEANNIRAEFSTLFQDIPSYLIYQAPNFKVRVGDFRTELEAIRAQRELAYLYPQGFVVRDLIQFPKLSIEIIEEESDEPETQEAGDR